MQQLKNAKKAIDIARGKTNEAIESKKAEIKNLHSAMSLNSILKNNTSDYKKSNLQQKYAALNSIFNVFEQSTIARDCANAIKKASQSTGTKIPGVPAEAVIAPVADLQAAFAKFGKK